MLKRLAPLQVPVKQLRLAMAVVLLLQALLPLTQVQTAQASTVSSAAFTGGTGTVSVGDTLYAKNGGALTLTVNTSSDTKCVEVTGPFTGRQTSSTAKSSWTFSFTAGTGDGVQTATAAASPNFNANNCTGQSQSPQSASFVLDNTGPVVTAAVSPVANDAGWNNSNVSITWSATDAGSRVATGPTPATDSLTANTSGVTKISTATDRLGNGGSGSVTVKLDKNAPTITGSRSPAANANGWNNTDVTVGFTCSDSISGIQSCTPSTTLSSNAANQSVAGTAVDNADNSASTTVGGINIDKVAPTLSGAPTSGPNAAGWYNGNVTIQWTAADGLSGLASGMPANSTISGEGTGLTTNASVSDMAGNTVNAASSPAVKIDKTAPNTTATAPANWNNSNVNVSLTGFDALSGVATTYYVLDAGAPQPGAGVEIGTEGIHTLQFWSVDNAGNTESAKSIQVKIDKTPPTINHTQAPTANGNGWNNTDVTVTFVCGDNLSGLASCTAAQTLTSEGQNQSVTGTSVDNAGNSATDPATVNIDKTAPVVTAAPDRVPNAANWYNNDVTIGFACSDALSGIDSCPTPQVLGEGADQSASGVASDAAGNSSPAAVSGMKVDKTAPSLTGAVTTPTSGSGWYNTDVTVAWTCGDNLSGVVACPVETKLTGEGSDQAASASVVDFAGNSRNTTVGAINIDKTAPSTEALVPDPVVNGWHTGPVQVTLNALDNLSGLKTTYFSVDNDPGVAYTGPFVVNAGGVHTVQFFSIDNAGNSEDYNAPGHIITFKIDNLAPTITGSPSPVANGKGWNNTAVKVSFDCDDQESGIASCSGPVTLSTEGQDQSVSGKALDKAGNTAGTTVTGINIDLTPPSTGDDGPPDWQNADVTVNLTAVDNLSGIDYTEYSVSNSPAQKATSIAFAAEGIHTLQYRSVDNAGNAEAVKTANPIQIDKTLPIISGATDRPANSNGWYKANVTVSFTCDDALSGVASCMPATGLGEGSNQHVTGTAQDHAGNSASATVSDINVDKTAPELSGAPTTPPNSAGWYNGDVTIAWTAADLLSGLEGAPPANSLVTAEGTNKLASATVKDLAGNETTATSSPAVNIDKTKPAIIGAADRPANTNSWYNANVTVDFTCDDTLSGIDACSPPQTLGEGSGQSASGLAVDKADNSAATVVDNINVDKTAPTIAHSQTPAVNSSGWNNTDVTVSFNCEDSLSGVSTCTGPQTVAIKVRTSL